MRQSAALILLSCLLAQGGSRADSVASARSGPDAADATLPLSVALCESRLDAAARSARNGRGNAARRELDELATRCAHLPQIHHDLGVLTAREGRRAEAIAHFEAALAIDPRARATLESLRALQRHEAALAYARALGTPIDVPEPRHAWQDSRDVGADTLRARAAGEPSLRRIEALEYELYDWWQSATGDTQARTDHYVIGFPRALALAARERDARIRWEDVRRDITFTAEDAVAILEQPGATEEERSTRRLLLLRLEGERWKIYRETSL